MEHVAFGLSPARRQTWDEPATLMGVSVVIHLPPPFRSVQLRFASNASWAGQGIDRGLYRPGLSQGLRMRQGMEVDDPRKDIEGFG